MVIREKLRVEETIGLLKDIPIALVFRLRVNAWGMGGEANFSYPITVRANLGLIRETMLPLVSVIASGSMERKVLLGLVAMAPRDCIIFTSLVASPKMSTVLRLVVVMEV